MEPDVNPPERRSGENASLDAGQRVGSGRYLLKRNLGSGGMGSVWLASDEVLNEAVALKFLPAEVRSDPTALSYLREETLSSRRLAHPNIIRIHNLELPPGEAPFIAMEYVEGTNLAFLRASQPQGVFTWEFLKPIARQLLVALDYAHHEKVIHRDLKPANIMLDRQGVVKLADLGIARTMVDTASRETTRRPASGTLLYMSPQQVEGKSPRPTDDLYSFGVTLYELLASRPPFYTGDVLYQVLSTPAPPLRERLEELGITNPMPRHVHMLIEECLAKNPIERPQSAREVASRLGFGSGLGAPGGHRKEEGGVARPPIAAVPVSAEAWSEPSRPSPPKPSIFWVGLALVFLLAVAGWFAFENGAFGFLQLGGRIVIDLPDAAGPAGYTLVGEQGNRWQGTVQSDLPIRVPPGRYSLAVTGQGWSTTATDIPVSRGATCRRRIVAVQIRSRPTKATVAMEGSGTGSTPYLAWTFADQLLSGTLSLSNHVSQSFTLNPSQATETTLELLPIPARAEPETREAGPPHEMAHLQLWLAPSSPTRFTLHYPDMKPEETWSVQDLRPGQPRSRLGVSGPTLATNLSSEEVRFLVPARKCDLILERNTWAIPLALSNRLLRATNFLADRPHLESIQVITVSLTSEPGNAEVRYRGKAIGTTPLNVPCLAGEDFEYDLRLAGYQSQHRRCRILDGAEPADRAELVRQLRPEDGSPFTNSLNMAFVQLRSNVWFGVFEVSRADYATFYSDFRSVFDPVRYGYSPGTNWFTAKFHRRGEQQDHPVVNVPWLDATRFCEWLTVCEQRKKALDDSCRYRLPYDDEWSQAVGLPEESGTTPRQRARASVDVEVFPWGSGFPPATNYNYHFADPYPYTAPVWSSPPNARGIYGLAGNVWEWCADAIDEPAETGSTGIRGEGAGSPRGKSGKDRPARQHVLRGGSFQEIDRARLHAGFRFEHEDAEPPRDDFGMRVVLEVQPRTTTARP